MLAHTLVLFTFGLVATLYACSSAPARDVDDVQDQPQKKKGPDGFKGFGKGFPGKGIPGKGFPGKGFPGKGFPGKGPDIKGEPKTEAKGEPKLDADTVKAKYEYYKKLHEENQRSNVEARIDRLISELQALREEVRGKK